MTSRISCLGSNVSALWFVEQAETLADSLGRDVGECRHLAGEHFDASAKDSLGCLSNSGPAVRRESEAGQQTQRRRLQETVMAQYLVAIYHPDNYDPSTEGEAMSRDIDALNDEMKAARVRIFVGGLSPARKARSLRAQPAGKVVVTDGPYIETKEHIGGFWVLEVTDLNEALAWGRKAAVACRAPVEVRPFN